MSQEATIIAVDDSDYMRNGDFPPSRLQAQNDAVSLICQSKRQRNPENTLGLISLANREVLCTLTNDSSKIYNRLHTVEPKGTISFCTSIRIAHLALRHRQLRHQKMRIVCFVGSPIMDDDKAMTDLAKHLKKEKVTVDIINFGENEVNQQKLTDFIDTLNGKAGGTSHLVSVPPGAVLHDSLVTSPIVAGEFGGTLTNTGLGLGFGLDPNEDPDLLYALRVSMEDQRMRQEQEANAGATTGPNLATALPAGTGTSEEAMLQQALAMSMNTGTHPPVSGLPMEIDLSTMTEEEQIAYALEISMQQQGESIPPASTQPAADASVMEVDPATPVKNEQKPGTLASAVATVLDPSHEEATVSDLDVIYDANFLQSVLKNLTGVDTKNEEVQKAISDLSKPSSKPKSEKNDPKQEDKNKDASGSRPDDTKS
ncbi:hypothetical protein P879_01800 [Paragonimus westermani]|uniref:26S proteasome non-ATPase regulatory subunit 4 n=1 Tax=Paragonimus westermani TaxID=34504 RepID=A0A8T0DPP9_9TREM|nr:hypothetical protein P879_01800 [Paragonimus westermani]